MKRSAWTLGAAALGMLGGSAVVPAADTGVTELRVSGGGMAAVARATAGAAAVLGVYRGWGRTMLQAPRYPRKDGWTNARYRRAAAKRRRVQANRRAHRG